MRIVRRDSFVRMPWKNGQGLTEEVMASPAGSGTAGFDWRISIAHVAADGPFSLFAGVDRTIALLDGPGLALDLPEGRVEVLAPDGAPFSFPGEWEISSRNLGGATIDLNVMTRRGRCSHTLRRRRLHPGAIMAAESFGWVLFAAPARIDIDGSVHAMARFDALQLEQGESFAATGNVAEIMVVTLAMAAA